MGITRTHEMHRRRFGRNLGVALLLAGFVALMFGLTVVKMSEGRFQPPHRETGT